MIEQVRAREEDSAPRTSALSRQLGLATATALVVGEVIGVGIFLTPAGMAQVAGLAVLAARGLADHGGQRDRRGALLRRAGGAVSRRPAGSTSTCREAYGPRVGFLYGWLSMLVTDPGLTACLAVGLATYVALPRPALGLGPEGGGRRGDRRAGRR